MAIMPVIQWLQHNSIVLMFAIFAVILIGTYWPGRKARIEQNGRIPLEDER
jgi:cbb3-type cytochrome oxidase subunit 3